MKYLNSANLAELMNIMLANAIGNTTTEEGASEPGLIVKEDLSNFVDGGKVLSNALTVENFRNVATGMLEGVGRIVYENARALSPTRFGLITDTSEYLTLLEKVRITGIEFEESYVLDPNEGAGSSFEDMFHNHPLTFTVKVWNTKGVFRTKPYTITLEQMQSSVRNQAQYAQLIGEIFAIVERKYNSALRVAERAVVLGQAMNTCVYRNGVNCIDVLAEFKKETGVTLTTQTYKNSDEFKRWFYGFIEHIRMLMSEASTDYNAESNLIDTDDTELKMFFVEPFITSLKTISHYQQGTSFQNALDKAYKIPYIQNKHEPQKISVKPYDPDTVRTSGKHVTDVVINDVIGMMWDKRGTLIAADKIKTGSQVNQFDEWTNYVHNFTVRQMCDKGSNAILFVAHNANEDKDDLTTTAYIITEVSD